MAELAIKIDPQPAVSAAGKISDSLNAVAASGDRAEKSLDDVGKATQRIENGRRVLTRSSEGMQASFDAVSTASVRMGRTANDNLQSIQRQMIATAGAGGNFSAAFDRLKASVLGASAAAGVAMRAFAPLFALIAVGSTASSIVRTSAEFESLGASLKTVTGSAANAERAMGYLKEFATDTPYGLREVTEAFIRLQALGLDPARKSMESYGNTASAMGKPLMQFIEAVADATTGEFERLKEFGIRARVEGERVAFTFQGMTTVVGNNTQAIQGYLRGLGENQFGGAMAEQMNTLRGTFAGLGDAADKFKSAIGEGGLSDAIKRVSNNTEETLNSMEGFGRTIGAVAGGAINLFADATNIASTALVEAWRWLKATWEVASSFVPTFAGAGQAIASVGAIMATVAEGFASAWSAAATAVYTRMNTIIGAGVGAYRAVEATWERLPAVFAGLAKRAGNAIVDGLQTAVNGSIEGVNSLIASVNSIAPEFAQIPAFKPVDLSAYKVSLTEAETATTETVGTIMSAAMSTDYLGKGLDAVAGPIAEVGKQIAAAKDRIDQAANSTKALGDTARQTGEGFQIAPPGTAESIENGITKPTKEATKALREAEAAKKALFSEADQAVAEFFPVETAQREAERLQALINDSSNGLSDLQRRALGLRIDQGFRDAYGQANNLSGGIQGVNDRLHETTSLVGAMQDVFADVFSSATRDGESFFDSITRGLAGIGNQLAAAGARNILGSLFGLPQDKSAAGIGGLIGQGQGYVGGNVATGGLASGPLTALNDNLAKTSRSALDVARQFNGLNEKADSTVLDGFLRASGNWKGMSSASTAWCAAFANAAIMEAGGKGTGSNMASSFLQWGMNTAAPKKGDIVVLRPQAAGTSGHVGFFEGFTDRGGVRVFSGNSGNQARSSVYDQRSVMQFRTAGDSGLDRRAYERATATGVADGMDRWAGQAGGSLRDVGSTVGGAQPLTFGQRALGALGAGAGIFSAGYQSGSPLQGGFSGALGGYQAAGALGFTSIGAGIAGGVLGAGLGILGGILGARKQREQEHRQKAAAWEQMRPAYEAFDASLSGEGKGDLRSYITEQWGQLSSFMSTGGAAWKYGSGNSTAQFNSTGTKLFEGFIRMLEEFRDGFDSMVTDMMSGQGLQGAFAKGRNATKELAEQLAKTRDDIDIAFGNVASIDFLNTPEAQRQAEETAAERERALVRFNEAASQYALSLLYQSETFSDVQQTIDGLRGTAAGLVPIFKDLGWNADDAAKAIDDRLNAAIANIARELEQSVSDRIADLSGTSYTTSIRQFLEEYEGLQRDFAAAGADSSRLPELFKLQAQAIVDGAELTGDAFAELVRMFPQLSGVVTEFAENAKRTASDLEALRLSYGDRAFEAGLDTSTEAGALSRFDRYANREREAELKAGGDAMLDLERALAAERLAIIRDFREREVEEAKRLRDEATSYLEGFTKDIQSYLDGLRAGPSSPLNGKDRLAEAEAQFAKQYALAKTGDRDALSEITSYADRLIDASRGYDASSPAFQAVFDRVTKALEDLPKLVRPEDLIKQAIEDAGKATVDALAVMKDALGSAFKSGPQATANALSVYFSQLDKSLDGLLSYDELRAGLAGIATDAQIRTMMNVLDANGDGQLSQLELIRGSNTQQNTILGQQNNLLSAISSLTEATRAQTAITAERVGEGNRIQGSVNTLTNTMSGHLGELRHLTERVRANLAQQNAKQGLPFYMTGGYTGDLPTTAAAGIVHGQEFVAHAEATRRWRPMLEQMNAGTFRMPAVAMPAPMPFSNDNRELVAEMRALRQEVSRLREENNAVTKRAGEHVREGMDGLADAAKSGERKERRLRAAGRA